jgi:pentatricopeptide repeat protein
MKQRIMILAALCGLIFASACARNKAKDQIETGSNSQPTSSNPVAGEQHESAESQFDLGGPCLPRGPFRQFALSGVQEEELRRQGKWDELIRGKTAIVRDDCSVPARWEQLFMALVSGRRHHEALQVLNEMTRRGFPLPNAVLERADPGFLAAKEFSESNQGIEYAAREKENQQNLRHAENALSSMAAKDLPPNPYRHDGACPFECCTYRQWRTKAAVQLRKAIDSSKIVAEIPAGASVAGLTGEVRGEPEPYAVLEDNGELKAGSVIFFLDNIGEGYVNYWYQGELNPGLGLPAGLRSYTYEQCDSNGASLKGNCSLKRMRPERKFGNEWWVKIRFAGTEGWALNTGQFDNVDACG